MAQNLALTFNLDLALDFFLLLSSVSQDRLLRMSVDLMSYVSPVSTLAERD